jgi:hypothetical protein
MSDVLIAAYHGGLGDTLQFSTLPEEFAIQQGRDTYVWDRAFFRNPEIAQLVWGTNPYVKGVKGGQWNAGDIPEIKFENVAGNPIASWEQLHGLHPVNKYPKIYYQPNKVDLSDVILVDASSITNDYEHSSLQKVYQDIRKEHPDKIFAKVEFQNQINPKRGIDIAHDGKHVTYDLPVDGKIPIVNIFAYTDVMASAFGLVSLFSGQSHLSSAIKNQYNPDLQSYCILSEDDHQYHTNKGIFIFDNIQYITYNP